MQNKTDVVTLDHGSGGNKTSALIEKMFLPALDNKALAELADGAVIEGAEKLVFSTDSFVVAPYFFPGGDIGKLAVCGTVNDIAVSGGIPKYLSLGMILEEGLPLADLEKITASIGRTAKELGVAIVTGDTKVVEKGKGDGIYINTSGIGVQACGTLSVQNIRPGDAVIVSGTVGSHGTAVMLARHPDFLQGGIVSDCASVSAIAQSLFSLAEEVRVMRDPTRGGLATTLCEFAESNPKWISIELEETMIPVDKEVQAACEIMGLDPLYSACEGRLAAVVSSEAAEEALQRIRSLPEGKGAQIIGRITDEYPGKVVLKTRIGGKRILSRLSGSRFPRIC